MEPVSCECLQFNTLDKDRHKRRLNLRLGIVYVSSGRSLEVAVWLLESFNNDNGDGNESQNNNSARALHFCYTGI